MNRADIPHFVCRQKIVESFILDVFLMVFMKTSAEDISLNSVISLVFVFHGIKRFDLISLLYLRLISWFRQEDVNIMALSNLIPPLWPRLWQTRWITISSPDTYSSVNSYLKRKSIRNYGLVQIGSGKLIQGIKLFAGSKIR